MVISKVDLIKEDPSYYKATKKPQLVDLDAYYYLTISGQSAPEDPQFLGAIEMLYAVGYTIKFISKADDLDFTVPKMEGFWWIEGGIDSQEEFEQAPRDSWCWKIAIRMPDFVEQATYFRAMENVKARKPEMKDLDKVKFELINEGRSVQVLHTGSYDEEKESIKKLMAFVAENDLEVTGKHHEIYLSDPRRTAPEKLRTILRYPVG